MKCALVFLLVLGCGLGTRAASQNPPEAQPPQTEVIGAAPHNAPPQAAESEAGSKDAAQVAALLHKAWLAAFRVNDLLTDLHPERWKLDEASSKSFGQTLEALRAQLGSVETSRSQFEKRADSVYLGYETYVALGAVLPHLDGMARVIAAHENTSLAAQYLQAQNQLFDAQQSLEPYLRNLLRNQDQLLLASQTNLAACENQLSYAMRASVKPATPMPNVLPAWPKRHPARRAAVPARAAQPAKAAPKSKPKVPAPAKPGQSPQKK